MQLKSGTFRLLYCNLLKLRPLAGSLDFWLKTSMVEAQPLGFTLVIHHVFIAGWN